MFFLAAGKQAHKFKTILYFISLDQASGAIDSEQYIEGLACTSVYSMTLKDGKIQN